MTVDFEQSNWIINQVRENFFDGSIKESDHNLNFRCPFCGDSKKSKTKKRGWLYLKNGECSFYCFNCGKTCSGFELVAHLKGISVREVRKECFKALKKGGDFKTDETLKTDLLPLACGVQDDAIDILPTWTALNQDCIDYLKGRHIFEAPGFDKNWELYYDTKTDRIVFPWRNEGRIEYYQMRAIRCFQSSKYLFPKGLQKKIYNLDKVDDNLPFMCFTEGLLDAIWVRNCVAVGGIFPSNRQFTKLEDMTISTGNMEHLIWISDNFWKDESAKREILKQAKIHPRIRIFNWQKSCPYKDINEWICAEKKFDRFWDPNYVLDNSITIGQASIVIRFRS